MPVPTDITAGTLTITNGSTAVTGVGTSWLASDLRQGDVILWIEGGDGFQTPILADVPASNTALTLVEPWEGPTLTGVRYRIRYQWDSSRVSAQSRQLIELLDNGNILALASLTGPGVPVFDGPHSMVIRPTQDFINGVAYDVQVDTLADRDAYDGQAEGFSVLVSDVGDGRSAVYSKASNTSGDWTDPAYVTGQTGATGPYTDLTVGPVTTVPYGTPASVDVVTVDPDTIRLDFSIPAGQNGTGTGDVVGPSGGVVNGEVALYGSTTGKLIKGSGKTLSDLIPVGYTGLRDTVSLNALMLADVTNTAVFYTDGMADHFDDLTYVGTGAAVNLDTSTAGVLKPTTTADTYTSSGSTSLTSNLTGYGTYATRERIPAGVNPSVGDRIRISLRAPTTGNSTIITDVWVGHSGTAANFDGTQVRLTFNGGATGVTLAAGSGVKTSDIIPYNFDGSKPFTVSFAFGNPTDVRAKSGSSGYTSYQKVAGGSEVSNLNVTGYSANAGFLIGVEAIEVRTATGVANNMIVRSQDLSPASIIPDTMGALLLVREIGSVVAGVDYTLSVSRDGGTTLSTPLTMTKLLTLPSGQSVVRAADISVAAQPSNNLPQWIFETLNNKNVEFHGVRLIYPSGASP